MCGLDRVVEATCSESVSELMISMPRALKRAMDSRTGAPPTHRGRGHWIVCNSGCSWRRSRRDRSEGHAAPVKWGWTYYGGLRVRER